jgi:O-antigen ligase
LASVVLVYNPPPVVNKFINGTDLVGDSPRQKIRNHSYYVYKSNPILGVGFGNYVHFGHDEIKEIVISEEGEYDSNKFLPSAHPHNVYYTYLVSGGLIMSSIFILFWLNILQIIYSFNKGSNEKWLIFSSVGVVMTVLGVGLVNTTLAHEHALIAMFVLGLLISRYRKLI